MIEYRETHKSNLEETKQKKGKKLGRQECKRKN